MGTTGAAVKATAKKSAAKNGAPAKDAAAKKATKKKSAAKKASAKKTAPAEKATAKKAAPVKKTSTKRSPSKKTPAKNTSAKKAPSAKKSPAPKTPAGKLAVLPDEDKWTAAEIKEVVAELTEDATRLRAELEEHEAEINMLMRESGEGAGFDQADVGASTFERDHEMTVFQNTSDMLAQTERALERIHDNSYGVCESCGNAIGKMRLMAFPRATLCMTCKQREERR